MPIIGPVWATGTWDADAWASDTWAGVGKLPLVISDGVVEQLQSGDVLINQEGTVVWATAGFGTDNVVLRSDGTGFGSQLSGLSITDDDQLIWPTTNIFIGDVNTGQSITTGSFNYLLGSGAGAAIADGIGNFYIGAFSGSTNVSGDNNVGVGHTSLVAATGSNNMALGDRAGASLTSGVDNIFIGKSSGDIGQKVDADNSIAIGPGVVTTASDQVVLGKASVTETILRGVVEGDSGTFVYAPSPFGTDNTIVRADGTGDAVQTSDLTLSDLGQLFWNQTPPNVILGYNQTGKSFDESGAPGVEGRDNMLLGGFCGVNITIGTRNMLIGGSTGSSLIEGKQNCCVGFGSFANNVTTTLLGDVTLPGEADDNVGIGNRTGLSIDTGKQNVFIGSEAGFNASQLVTADNSIAIGYLTFTTADNQVVIGNTSITETILRGVVEGDSGTFVYAPSDLAVDNSIVRAAGTGVAVQTSGLVISDSDQLVFTDTSKNVFIGDSTTGEAITSGIQNFLLGGAVGRDIESGSFNTYIGISSGITNVSGDSNASVGHGSLSFATGDNNVAIGFIAGGLITTGEDNVFIGALSGVTGQLGSASNSIGIGSGVVTTASNQVVLGNASITETILRGNVFTGDGAYETLKRIAPTSSASLTTETLVLVDATSGAVTITLSPAADLVDTPVHVKKIDASAFAVIIEGDGAETIDDQLNATITAQYVCITVVSDGTEWWIL